MQEIFQLGDYVHFGAIVNIVYEAQKQKKILCSDGISIRSLLSLSDFDKQVDISTSLFKIQPHIKFPFNNEVDNVLKEKYKKTKPNRDEKKATIGIIDEFQFELTENIDTIEKMKKAPIKYGQEFMLQHIHSCKYLTFKKESEGSSTYYFELTQVPNQNSCFSFSACYHYQDQISQFIPFGSQLHFNIKIQNQIDSRIATLNFKKGNVLEEWEISFQEKVSIVVELYQTAEQEHPEFIYYGSSLWIFHLETNSFLKFQSVNQDGDNFFLKKIKYSLGLSIQGTTTEMSNQKDVFLQRTENEVCAETIGLWKIEHKDRFKGGKIKFDDEITFYNIRYKVYLSVEKIVNRRQISYRLTVEKQNSQNTHFRMKGLSTNSQYVTSSDLVVIQHIFSECYLGVQLDTKRQAKQYKVTLTTDYKNQDNFKFTTVGFMPDWQNNFILSVLPFIEEGSNLLQKDTRTFNIKQQSLLLFIRDNLLELMNFSEDLSQSFEMSESKLGKISFNHYSVQKLLRQQGFLGLLPKLLNKIDPQKISISESVTPDHFRLFGLGLIMSDNTQTSYPKIQDTLESIVRIIFRIIRNATKCNIVSSNQLLPNLSTTIKFLGYKCGAEEFFISFFKNNPKLLDRQDLFLPEIQSQYRKMQSNTSIFFPQAFKLFNSFMYRQNEGINNTQMKIFQLMILSKSTLLLPISSQGLHLFVNYANKAYQLSEFCNFFSHKGPLVKTLANQLQFYTYLCYGRNYVCSKYVKSIFHFDLLYSYLGVELSNDIKASLLLIVTRCYLDERPRFRESLPSLIYSLRPKKKQRPQYLKKDSDGVFQMVRLHNPYQIQQKSIMELLDCVSLDDSLSVDQISKIKKWVLGQVQQFLATTDIDEFYDRLNEINLSCLKNMIQLKMFSSSESEKIQKIIFQIINKLKTSMEYKGQTYQFESENFNEILEEMLAKNILKKFNTRDMFDGVEDQIDNTNITLRFIKYAYYQNLFLQKSKNTNKDNLISNILELIDDSLKLSLDNKLVSMINLVRQFTEDPVSQQNMYRAEAVQKIITQNIFRENQVQQSFIMNMIQSLVLIFFDSNNYQINHKSLYQTLTLIYNRPLFLKALKKTIIIVNDDEERVMDMIKQNYFEVKLLVQTSEVWLSNNYAQPRYIYTPIIHYVVDKLYTISNIIVNPKIQNSQVALTVKIDRSQIKKYVSIQKQIIVMNMGHHKQVLGFLVMTMHLFQKIDRVSHPGYQMFESCFMFLNVYIHQCKVTKNTIKEHIPQIVNFIRIGKLEAGQTSILVQFMKNNYTQSLYFCQKYLEEFMDFIMGQERYNSVYGRLIRTVLSHYNQPIRDNLVKVFSALFEVNFFRKFLWVTTNKVSKKQFQHFGEYIFQLNKNLITHQFAEPYLYQAEAIDVIIFLMDHLEQCRNIFKTHIKNTLKFEYLFYLLTKRDYYSDQTSSDASLKLHLILKIQIAKLIDRVYLQDLQQSQSVQFQEMLKFFLNTQSKMYDTFIDEFPSRKETLDFRRPMIARVRRQDESKEHIHKIFGPKIKDMYHNELDLLKLWRDCMLSFVKSILTTQSKISPLAKDLQIKIQRLNQMLYESKQSEQQIQMSYQWLIQSKGRTQNQKKIKNICSAWILDSISSQKLMLNAMEHKNKLIRQLALSLSKLGISKFDFIRKIAELIEDSLQKMIAEESNQEIQKLLKYVLRFLRDMLIASNKESQDQLRLLLAKSQIIFPLLNYFQDCKMNKQNKKLFKIFIEFLNELLGEEGNKTIQNVLHQYFSNKVKSIEIFLKIKKIIGFINFEKTVDLKSKLICNAMTDLKQITKHQQPYQNVLFSFLTLLCKGNNMKTQLFLTQLNRVSSFDIIKLVLSILKDQSLESVPLINRKNYKLIIQSFSIIRQLIEGPCNQNQDYFLNSAFFDISLKYFRFSMNDIKQLQYSTPKSVVSVINQINLVSNTYAQKLLGTLKQQYQIDDWMISQIKFKCISTIGSLLQQNVSDQAINKLIMSIPKDEIIKNINLTYERYQIMNLEYTSENLQLTENKQLVLPLGFKLYFILQYYAEKNIQFQKDQEALKFFEQHTRTIQVVHSRLFTLRFPLPPVEISEAFQKQFLQTADRTSINSKLKDLQQTEVQNRRNNIGYILLILVLTVNLLDLVSLDVDSLVYIINFNFTFRGQTFLLNEDPSTTAAKIAAILFVIASLVTSVFLLVYEWTGARYMVAEIRKLFGRQMKPWKKFVAFFKLLYDNLSYLYYYLTTIVLFLSLFNPIFDSIILIIEMFKQLDMFLEIGKAIKESFLNLMVVVLIYILSVYTFVIVIYFVYVDKYQPCTGTLYSCLCFGLQLSLKADAGVLGYNDGDEITSDYQNFGIQNMLFDMVMLFVLVVIVEQVLGAIIVDKFAEIRQDTQKREIDEQTKCYICGLDVQLLDRQQDGFQVHKNKYHNIWNYFYFLVYLKNSKAKDLSGIQLFVNRCKQNGDLRWFPINRSLTLENKRKRNNVQTSSDHIDEQDAEEKIMDEEMQKINKIIKQVSQLVNFKIIQNQIQV